MKVTAEGTGSEFGRPLELLRPGDGNSRHGTRNGYQYHQCRCNDCRAAWAAYARDLRRRKREANGAA
jgi:hypothetical protein